MTRLRGNAWSMALSRNWSWSMVNVNIKWSMVMVNGQHSSSIFMQVCAPAHCFVKPALWWYKSNLPYSWRKCGLVTVRTYALFIYTVLSPIEELWAIVQQDLGRQKLAAKLGTLQDYRSSQTGLVRKSSQLCCITWSLAGRWNMTNHICECIKRTGESSDFS